jgi:hypothetical protein
LSSEESIYKKAKTGKRETKKGDKQKIKSMINSKKNIITSMLRKKLQSRAL